MIGDCIKNALKGLHMAILPTIQALLYPQIMWWLHGPAPAAGTSRAGFLELPTYRRGSLRVPLRVRWVGAVVEIQDMALPSLPVKDAPQLRADPAVLLSKRRGHPRIHSAGADDHAALTAS